MKTAGKNVHSPIATATWDRVDRKLDGPYRSSVHWPILSVVYASVSDLLSVQVLDGMQRLLGDSS